MSNSLEKYCRPGVEKFIYARVYGKLFPAYIADVDCLFKENLEKLKKLKSEE